MGDNKYDLVIINPNTYKENIKPNIHIPCTCTFIIHTFTKIYLNTWQERVFMIKSFLFNIQARFFMT